MPWPDGHFYSPVPSERDLERAMDATRTWSQEALPGVVLDFDAMLQFAAELGESLGDFTLERTPTGSRLYGSENSQFNVADAAVLSGVISRIKPARLVEIGSGYSTVCALDAVARFSPGTAITCIEPYPERLLGQVAEARLDALSLIVSEVQDLPLETFTSLAAGDILFIDSSHVAKPGSDVLYELLYIVPRLKAGIWVHVHDIFPLFEYPVQWLRDGRYWTESYLLHGLLINNNRLSVKLWPKGLPRVWLPPCL